MAITYFRYKRIASLANEIDAILHGKEQINLIFDMVVPFSYDDKKQKELRTTLVKLLHVADKRYQCVITLERSFVADAKE